MNRKRVLAVILVLTMALCLAACGSGGGGENGKASGNTSAVSSGSSVEEDSADEDATEESSEGDLLEEFEFTKTVFNQDLENPITACGLKYDESKDRQFEEALDQTREDLHLHIGILESGYNMDTHLEKCQSDNITYVTSVARGYNIQQADAANADGTAKFTVVRFTHFEDDGENDYDYMGDLVYTDGTSVAYTEFMYSIDKEYGNGEEVEAAMKAITGYYGIDYDKLKWVDQESGQ